MNHNLLICQCPPPSYTQVSVAEKLSITRAAVGVLANRGREIEAQSGWGIVDKP